MGRPPSCDEDGRLNKGPWTPEEDRKLRDYIMQHGHHGCWRRLPKLAGLSRCGKSCRLRWTNYLRPDIKRGDFTDAEEKLIIQLHAVLGNKWSAIATRLPGRTDNEIKNYWNTHVRKKLLQMGIDPVTHQPRTDDLGLLAAALPSLLTAAGAPVQGGSSFVLERLIELQLAQTLVQILTCGNGLFGSAAAGKRQLDDIISTSILTMNPNSLRTPNLQQVLQPAPAARDWSPQGMVTVNESCCTINSSANSMFSGSPESTSKSDTMPNADQIWDGLNLDLENELAWKEFINQITTSSRPA